MRKIIKTKKNFPVLKHTVKNFLYPFYKFSQGHSYLKFYPLYGSEEFDRYRIDAPYFIHVWDSATDMLLKIIKGLQIKYNSVMMDISGLSFDSYFIKEKLVFCKALEEEEDMESAYFRELYALRLSFPKTFLLPHEFRFADVSPVYDTFDPKRRRRRAKYKSSKHYKQWLVYSQRYNDLIGVFMPLHEKSYLENRKKLFFSIPDFSADNFLPRDRIEALHFFTIFGAPSKKCRNFLKSMLFINLLLAGNYMNHASPASFSRVIIARNILMNHSIDSSIYYYKKEQFIKPLKKETDNILSFNLNLFRLKAIHFFTFFRIRFSRYIAATRIRFLTYIMLKRNRFRFWTKFYFDEGWNTFRSEFSLSFYRNPASFLWAMSPNKFKVFIMTWYMAGIEILHDNRTEKYFDVNWTDPSDTFTETWKYKLLDTARFFYYDCIKYPLVLLFRPWIELFVVYPFYFLFNNLLKFFVHLITLKNNLWYSFLTSKLAANQVKGLWWRFPILLLKILFKVFLFLFFIYFFIFEISYMYLFNLIGLDGIPFFLSWDRGEIFIIYIFIVVYIALLFFGSFAIREYIWIETGPMELFSVLISYILWSWRVDSTLAVHTYYPYSWLDFSVLENNGEFSYDRTTLIPARYDSLSSSDANPSKKYAHRTFNWRLGYTGVALGSESDLIEEFKVRNH